MTAIILRQRSCRSLLLLRLSIEALILSVKRSTIMLSLPSIRTAAKPPKKPPKCQTVWRFGLRAEVSSVRDQKTSSDICAYSRSSVDAAGRYREQQHFAAMIRDARVGEQWLQERRIGTRFKLESRFSRLLWRSPVGRCESNPVTG